MNMNGRAIIRTFVSLRWLTRVVSSLAALFIIYLLISYTFGPERSVPGASMIVTLSLITVGVALSWRWEGWGGLIILAGSVLLFALYPHIVWPPGLYHLMPIAAILYLVCWFVLRNSQTGKAENK